MSEDQTTPLPELIQLRLSRLEEFADKYEPDEDTSGAEDLDEYLDNPETISRYLLISFHDDYWYLHTYETLEEVIKFCNEVIDDPTFLEAPHRVIDLDTLQQWVPTITITWAQSNEPAACSS